MNIDTPDIEAILRQAPRPEPPADLKPALVARLKLPPPGAAPSKATTRRLTGNWVRRWGWVLAPATASLACAVVFTVQQVEITNLKQKLRAVLPSPAAVRPAQPLPTPVASQVQEGAAGSATFNPEATQLERQIAQLGDEVNRLEQLQAENDRLRTQLARAMTLPPEVQTNLAALDQAEARAQAIACVNNLKQLGLAVRLWATDNGETLPPDLRSMSNEISSLKMLVCPADTNRQPAQSWAALTSANASYQYLGVAGESVNDPHWVLFICPIHGTVTMADGSVQMGMAKAHPERLVRRQGKLYYENSPSDYLGDARSQRGSSSEKPSPAGAPGGAPNP
ncbi:MAG: hypothetical protein KGS61_10880 [Verrucomicrobia bacterium]|nr:hypothetical protein [Verrucomicrobiota bacterium]